MIFGKSSSQKCHWAATMHVCMERYMQSWPPLQALSYLDARQPCVSPVCSCTLWHCPRKAFWVADQSLLSAVDQYLVSLGCGQHQQASAYPDLCRCTSTESQHRCISLAKEILSGWGRSALPKSVLLPLCPTNIFSKHRKRENLLIQSHLRSNINSVPSWIVIVPCGDWGGVLPININGLVLWWNPQGPHRRLTYLGINTAVARLAPAFKLKGFHVLQYSNLILLYKRNLKNLPKNVPLIPREEDISE